jgi:hypothetical protein
MFVKIKLTKSFIQSYGQRINMSNMNKFCIILITQISKFIYKTTWKNIVKKKKKNGIESETNPITNVILLNETLKFIYISKPIMNKNVVIYCLQSY